MMKLPPPVETTFDFPERFEQIVTGYPVGAQCQHGSNLCDREVAWHASFHGCNQQLLCEDHAAEWIDMVMGKLRLYGSVTCESCGREFTTLLDATTLRKA